ncbi:MAG: SBBP repeat-containing protein [Ignavibacteria bacterium]|nr:SBBP repeat-containing protein [Ignavibacteria bacterium]
MNRREYSQGNSMVIDDAENVYVTGKTGGYTDSINYCTVKYNKSGDVQWEAITNSKFDRFDEAKSIAVDNEGNVYVTGDSYTSQYYFDYLTVKYNSSGIEQWARSYNGPNNFQDFAASVKVDNNGNVYVTGYSRGNGTDYDYATIKYNAMGEEQWVRRYNGTSNYYDRATAMVLDDSGNIYVTGYSSHNWFWADFLTIKYNSSGTEQWVARFKNFETASLRATAIAVDRVGNVYVTGDCFYEQKTYSNYGTIKYNSNGALQFSVFYDGTNHVNDWARSIAIDTLGNVCVTGTSEHEYATVMYDTNLTQKWVAIYTGEVVNHEAYAVALDQYGNVYVTGGGSGLNDPYRFKYTTIKYNNAGVQQWLQIFSEPGISLVANSIAIGKSGAVYVSGGVGYNFLTLKYSQSTDIVSINNSLANYKLSQNYPNPFNPSTLIEFSLPEKTFVSLKVFNVMGKEISEFVNENLSEGTFQYEFNADNLPSGIYFYKLKTENFTQTRKMILIR